MKRFSHRSTLASALLGFLLLGLASCGGTDLPTDVVTPVATTVLLSPPTLSLSAFGETQQFAASVRDQNGAEIVDASVTWSSSPSSVATVSPTGLVEAIAEGTAEIRATSGSATGTLSITVQQVVDSIAFSPSTVFLTVTGDTVTVIASVMDAGGSGIESPDLTWSSSDESIATVGSTGLVTAGANGAALITVEATSGGQTIQKTLSVTVAVPLVVVTTTSLPDGVNDVGYGVQTLEATGGDGTYSWALTLGSGPLPPGLTLATNGDITGTPTAVGTSGFTVEVASGNQIVTQALSITVSLRPVLLPSELCSNFPDYAIATFADAALEGVVRSELSVGAQGDLTCGLISGWVGPPPGGSPGLDSNSALITNLLGIQNFTSLRSIFFSGGSFTDISALSELTSLQELTLPSFISDIAPLSGLANLTDLTVRGTFTNIDALSGLTALTNLSLRGDFTDINALSGLTNLSELRLNNNSIPITDISPLSELTSLTELFLTGNSITNVGPLSALTSLIDLRLNQNSITDVSSLSGLTSLTFLQLSDNQITTVTGLGGLTSVETLSLNNNSITGISSLSGLASLRSLNLTNNAIAAISAPLVLPSLIGIDLFGNSLTDISGLETLTTLVSINLRQNGSLTNIQPLIDNTGLGAGDTVELRSTNVSCPDISTLEAKGVTVTSDCP